MQERGARHRCQVCLLHEQLSDRRLHNTKCLLSARLLVAIDRRNGMEVAMETVKLAEEFMLSSDGLVVGIDLSGDPTVSSAVLLGVFMLK